LVLAGGGAKGAYTFGCLEAFRERGISFDAIAGASAGALNAILWSTGRHEAGKKLWKELSFSSVYPFKLFNPWGHSRWFLRVVATCYVIGRLYWESLHGRRTPLRRLWLAFNWSAALASLASLLLLSIDLDRRGHALSLNWPIIPTLFFSYLGFYGILRSRLNIVRFGFLGAALGTVAFGVCYFLLGFGVATQSISVVIYFSIVLLGMGAYFTAARAFGDDVSVLGQTGLRNSLNEILRYPLRVPTLVALSRNVDVFDPDEPSWAGTSPAPGSSITPNTKNQWTTEYLRIDEMEVETAVTVCLASSALPFGIVPSVRVGKELYVDGGLTDNVPVFPFLDSSDLDEVFVVLLEPVESLPRTLHRIGCDIDGFSVRDRAIRVAKYPIPGSMPIGEGTGSSRNRPPTVIPFRYPKSMPQVRIFHPKRKLGGLWAGTLNFDGEFACRLIEEGYRDTIEAIDLTGHSAMEGSCIK
jgi:predicted acylesterase/phospholipase RssA